MIAKFKFKILFDSIRSMVLRNFAVRKSVTLQHSYCYCDLPVPITNTGCPTKLRTRHDSKSQRQEMKFREMCWSQCRTY